MKIISACDHAGLGLKQKLAHHFLGLHQDLEELGTHNDSNVLCLGGRFIGHALALEIVDTWLQEPFEGGRQQRRLDLIEGLART